MAKYYTLVTNVGKAKMANAQVTGDKVEFSKIALGSGGGNPKETQETLVDQKWKGNISNVSIDSDNPNWVVVEAVVPSSIGGFMINEVGLFDDEGDLIVIGKYPETYKPKGDEGTVKDIAVRVIIEVTNTDSVTMKVDPSVVIATRKYVDEKVKQSSGEVDDVVNEITDGSITIESLETNSKTLVGSINEVKQEVEDNFEALGEHEKDTEKHITSSERESWNAKETTSASQEKANKALSDAKGYTDEKIGSLEFTKESVGLGNVTNVEQASKQEFDDLDEEVTTHLAESVTDEKGAHNFRITDGKAEYYEDDKWNRLRVGTPFRVGNVIGLSINQKPGRILEVSWQDPADLTMQDENDETVILTRWAGTQLRRKTGAYPVDESDGELVVDNKERGKYSGNPFQDEDLEDGTEYFYMIFPYTEEGEFTVDAANRIKEIAVTKLDRSAPSGLSVSNIEYDRATVTSNSGAVVSLNKNTWYSSPHTFTGLTEETEYTPYAKFEEDDTYYESPIKTGSTFETPSEAPGPGKLIAGDENAGFYGEVPASELFTGSELASIVGVTQGTIQNDNTPWLKYIYNGKICFRPKKSIRYSTSWDEINRADCVDGTRIIEKNGMQFKVRLMRGATQDPASDSRDRDAKGSEWNKIMLPISEKAIDKSWSYSQYVEGDIPIWEHGFGGGDRGMYTDGDLGFVSGNGYYHWCQEVSKSNSSYRVIRGNSNGPSYSDWTSSSSTLSSRGWSPVLELL